MNKNVLFARVAFDKTKAFLGVEELNCSLEFFFFHCKLI